jgi:hypothetical protein
MDFIFLVKTLADFKESNCIAYPLRTHMSILYPIYIYNIGEALLQLIGQEWPQCQ